MDSLLSAIHSYDLMVAALFALMWLKLMMAMSRVCNVQSRSRRRPSHTRNDLRGAGILVTKNIKRKQCMSNPSGDVLRIYLEYYKRNTDVNVHFDEEMENAARFGMDNLEVLTSAIKSALKVSMVVKVTSFNHDSEFYFQNNLNTWSVDIFVEKLAFFRHIRCNECPKDENTSPEDEMKSVLALTKIESSSGSGTFPLCRRDIFVAIHDKLHKNFM